MQKRMKKIVTDLKSGSISRTSQILYLEFKIRTPDQFPSWCLLSGTKCVTSAQNCLLMSRFGLIRLPFSFFLLLPLMMHLHLHSYSVLPRLLMCHHPMQTFISDSYLVISDSSYDSPEPQTHSLSAYSRYPSFTL